MTEDELQAFCQEWQRKLRITDWDITLNSVDEGEMGDWKDGEVRYQIYRREATINVFHGDDVCGTILHELLHVMLSPLTHGREEMPSEIAMEQVIETLTNALMPEVA